MCFADLATVNATVEKIVYLLNLARVEKTLWDKIKSCVFLRVVQQWHSFCTLLLNTHSNYLFQFLSFYDIS